MKRFYQITFVINIFWNDTRYKFSDTEGDSNPQTERSKSLAPQINKLFVVTWKFL